MALGVGVGGPAEYVIGIFRNLLGLKCHYCFYCTVLYCLCTGTPHCVRTYAFPCPLMPPIVTHPLGIGYASVSEEWRRPAYLLKILITPTY